MFSNILKPVKWLWIFIVHRENLNKITNTACEEKNETKNLKKKKEICYFSPMLFKEKNWVLLIPPSIYHAVCSNITGWISTKFDGFQQNM